MEKFISILKQISGENDPVSYAIPFFIIFMLIEIWVDVKEKSDFYHSKEATVSIGMGLVSVGINIFTKAFYFVAFGYIYQNYRLFDLSWAGNWLWIFVFFGDDFSFYWHHRLSHQVRILWAAHSNHHSSQDYNLAVALRQSWTEGSYKYLFYIWMPFLGVPPTMVFVMAAISLVYQFFLHTQVVRKTGFLEYVFNTPSHHRVHHGTNLQYLDKNYAGILIIWDRFFGSFEPENETVVYGLTKNINTQNILKIASAEFKNIAQDLKKAHNTKEKFHYLFNSPNWKSKKDISEDTY
jgi:sterol desaturase/sphingolipid hydroxylase (fatty acid hydroxylase superfamily)